jgi:hypothetical protein
MKYFIVTLLVLLSSHALAETYSHTDTVYRLGAITTRDDADYVILNGFTSAGTCPVHGGLVSARFRYGAAGDRAFSIALAASMANKPIRVSVDDTDRHPVDNTCFVKSLEIRD